MPQPASGDPGSLRARYNLVSLMFYNQMCVIEGFTTTTFTYDVWNSP